MPTPLSPDFTRVPSALVRVGPFWIWLQATWATARQVPSWVERRAAGRGGGGGGGERAPPRGGAAGVELLDRRGEEIDSLEEEGALLRVEDLEGGEVELHLVGFDLAEVGVEGGVEGEARGEAELEIDAGRWRDGDAVGGGGVGDG